jgi:hypothetical protein
MKISNGSQTYKLHVINSYMKFIIKPRINKSNGQINFSLPKLKLTKNIREKAFNIKEVKFDLKEKDFTFKDSFEHLEED